MKDLLKSALNEGTVDRVVRVGLGAALLATVFVGPQTAFGWLGIVPLVTGLTGFCPVYRLAGFRTTSVKARQESRP